LIAHGHIMVNGKKMRIPSYSVRSGDVIEVSKREAIRKITTSAVELNKGQQVPQWLEAEPEKLRGKVLNLPRREDVLHPINEQLIVELCSR
jgi:small subunit ribosomal protein S4